MSNIVKAVFGSLKVAETAPLWQYDYGQILQIIGLDLPETYEVHFSNSERGAAKTAIGGPDGVMIPDEYLTSGEKIFAWIFLHTGANDGETRYKITIPVRRRASISDAPPTPQQQEAITQAIAALTGAVDEAEAAAASAASSLEALLSQVGDLSDLETSAKENIVAAVNEVNGKGLPDGGEGLQFLKKSGIEDYQTEWDFPGICIEGTLEEGATTYINVANVGINLLTLKNAFEHGMPIYLNVSGYGRFPLVRAYTTFSIQAGMRYFMYFAGPRHSPKCFSLISFSLNTPSPSSMYGTLVEWEDRSAYALQDIGDLENLDTIAKSSLVAAINEIAQGGGGGGSAEYFSLTLSGGGNSGTVTPGTGVTPEAIYQAYAAKKAVFAEVSYVGGVQIWQLVDAKYDSEHNRYTITFALSVANEYWEIYIYVDDVVSDWLWSTSQSYVKPSSGIPKTDLASAVQTSLGKADSAYQKPSGGVPSSDMASAVQTSLGKADTAYQKPSSGIPATDLASDVQTSLGKADTALQSYTETDPTVPSWAKESSKPSYTASEVGAIPAPSSPSSGDVLTYNGSAWAASEPHYVPAGGNSGALLAKSSADDYQLYWRTISDYTAAGIIVTAAATAAKICQYSFWDDTHYPQILYITLGLANTAASALTLKVNGKGPYPIYINGTASSATNYTLPAGAYVVYFDGTNFYFDTTGKIAAAAFDPMEVTISTAGAVTQALDPGKIYHFTGALTSLTITLNAAASGQLAQYHFDFDAGSTAPTLTLPNTVTMPSGFQVEANKHYEIDILDGYGVAQSW